MTWRPARPVSSPLELAGEVGYSLAGNIGQSTFEELEIIYATGLLPSRFKDDPVVRVRQNLLLWWQLGFYKTTLLKTFGQSIPPAIGTIDVTSMTLEKVFGSIDASKKHIIEPAFTNDVRLVIISELTALLGQRDAMRQFVNIMNGVLEGEKISRQILKLGYGEISNEELKEHEAKGVSYDSIRGELSYTPDVCVLGATRPLDNKYYSYLQGSGHLSRYHIVQESIDEEEALAHLRRDYKLDGYLFDKMKETNLKLSQVKVNSVIRPSSITISPIFKAIEDIVKEEIARNPSLTLADVITPRLKGDVLREVIGHAFLREAQRNNYQDIDTLCCSKVDVEYALRDPSHFVSFSLNPIIAKSWTRLRRKAKKTGNCKWQILMFLKDKQTPLPTKEIFKYLDEEGVEARQATRYLALKQLKDRQMIEEIRIGRYRLTSYGQSIVKTESKKIVFGGERTET